MALGLEAQPSPTNLHSSLREQVLEALCLQKEGLRISISSLEMRRWLQRAGLVWMRNRKAHGSGLTAVGYGIHYPVRHGQVENWVCLSDLRAGDGPADIQRITWNASGQTRSLSTFALNRKTTTSYLRNLYVPPTCSNMSPLTVYSH